MKNRNALVGMIIFALLCQLAVVRTYADDTCTFMTTANDIPPNIVILLDNGASMEEIVWHSGYDNSKDYTPIQDPQAQIDNVQNIAGNGFYRDKGYSIKRSGNKYYLVEIPDDLVVANSQYSTGRQTETEVALYGRSMAKRLPCQPFLAPASMAMALKIMRQISGIRKTT